MDDTRQRYCQAVQLHWILLGWDPVGSSPEYKKKHNIARLFSNQCFDIFQFVKRKKSVNLSTIISNHKKIESKKGFSGLSICTTSIVEIYSLYNRNNIIEYRLPRNFD